MTGRRGYAVALGVALLAGVLLSVALLRASESTPEYAQREWVERSFAAELGRGSVGGVGLERLAEMTAGGAGDGIWQSAVFDPVENCWYLPGWIDNARVGSWRVALLLTAVPGHGKPHAWRFYLRCAGLVPFDQPTIEMEGAWREDDGGIRLAWAERSACGQDEGGTQIVRVGRQKLLCVVSGGDVRRRAPGSVEGNESCWIASARQSPGSSRKMPDGGTRNASMNDEP